MVCPQNRTAVPKWVDVVTGKMTIVNWRLCVNKYDMHACIHIHFHLRHYSVFFCVYLIQSTYALRLDGLLVAFFRWKFSTCKTCFLSIPLLQ